ncbi:hypothetical protein SO802_032374 [Lithocarpus litseifolius]|uniref:Uncharacterized protein n=1 Tax=Lithocarpus litseifolius TaxID=425828 RepID=A0AAW2BPY9_9ROSI
MNPTVRSSVSGFEPLYGLALVLPGIPCAFSKESGAGDTEMTLADSFTKASVSMPENRKHKAMGSITEEKGSVEQRRRKREKKINALIPSSNEHHSSFGEKVVGKTGKPLHYNVAHSAGLFPTS